MEIHNYVIMPVVAFLAVRRPILGKNNYILREKMGEVSGDYNKLALSDWCSSERLEQASWSPLHLLDGHFEERPISAQSYLR